jgi:hypothetical protein
MIEGQVRERCGLKPRATRETEERLCLDVVVSWFATKQLAFAGLADILRAEHGNAGDDGSHSRGNESGCAPHAELLAAC